MQGETNQGRSKAELEAAKSGLTDKMESATGALDDARREVSRKAGEYASEAKEAVVGQAQATQRDISASLIAFGGALRAASEHLANSDERTAAKLVLDAAGGLERLSTSLKDKPFEDVLGEIRSFGRDNSGALIAGSVMAGLALGRFIKSSEPINAERGTVPKTSGGAAQGREATSPDESDRS